MHNPVRIGILGGGGILGSHAPAYAHAQGRCVVTAVAEPDPARHAAVRALLGDGPFILADYRDVIALDDVDAVDIILPHDLHMPATIDAAAAGKHVLVEKPMARNVYECDRMIEACERAGVSLTVCHDRRYHGELMALADVVASGCLGDIFYWKLEHNQDVLFPQGAWVRTRRGLGGGAVMSCLTHQLDLLRWMGGEAACVTCMTRVLPDRMEGETAGVLVAQMRSGALANLSINWCTRSHTGPNALWYELAHVCGARGEAYHLTGKGVFVRLHAPAEPQHVERWSGAALEGFVPVPAGSWSGHVRCIAEWVSSLRGEPSAVVTSARDVRGTVELAEAAYRSEESGCVVKLPIEPTPWREPA